jgi:hypothetical protein
METFSGGEGSTVIIGCYLRARELVTPFQINPKILGTLNETIMACPKIRPDRRTAGMFEIQHQVKAVAKYRGLEPGDLKGAEVEE